MTKGINKVFILGYVGGAPKVTLLKDNEKKVQISVATNEQWKDKTTGEVKKKTEWHNVVFTPPLSDFAEQHISKGQQVYIEGAVKTHQWLNQLNETRYTTEIHAKQIQMLT